MAENFNVIFLACAVPTLAWAGALDAANERIVSMPMHQYASDCGMKSQLRLAPGAASFMQGENVPGAGITAFKAFDTVLKDGFLEVACVKDYMYYHGDKFGGGRHDYKLGAVSNVSIVHYDEVVAKEDRKEMTQKRCFEFCRTVPNMGFFGIVNGRNCYCTPYFKQMASDSSQCDAVCEGENTLLCGGKSKSSVFAMHMCGSTAEDLHGREDTAAALEADLRGKTGLATAISDDLQKAAEAVQKSFGAVGDSGAANLAQEAKVSAGKLIHEAEDGDRLADELRAKVKSGKALTNFEDPEQVTTAERIMEDLEEMIAKGEGLGEALDKSIDLAHHQEAHKNASKQYYPVMYFVDKKFADSPSTCTGDAVAQPMVGSADRCASACDSHVHSCVGFQFFKDVGDVSFCTLFSNFKTAHYYTGCGNSDAGKSFLQTRKAASFGSTCFAKFSKFEGTSLKPDGKGKCKQCFKDVKKADRCY